MEYPFPIKTKVKNVFSEETIGITIYSGLLTFIGPNGSGKTQTLKSVRDRMKSYLGHESVRYLSSNRIGRMEQYRSRTDQYNYSPNDFNMGDHSTKKLRHEIETANGDFFAMDERKDIFIKVAERLSVLFKKNIFIRWDNGQMKVFLEDAECNGEYSVVDEASGLINIISILAALYDETVKVLLIDEPEVSLHPQLQSYLLNEIKNVIKTLEKTVIISTHSIHMVALDSAEEICNLVFFQDGSLPKQVPPDTPELQNKKLQDFILRMGLSYKEGFFAKKVLLIEGISDLIICKHINNKLKLNLDVAGTQIIPVDGKGQFPVIAKFFRLIGKEVYILTDLDGFIDDNSIVDFFTNLPSANQIANQNGSSSMQRMIREGKTRLVNQINKCSDVMLSIYKDHPYWVSRDAEIEERIAIKRAITAQLLSAGDEELKKWPDCDNWKSIKFQILAILDYLEKLGCFVLRRGAIESYYFNKAIIHYDDKPQKAIYEINNIKKADESTLCEKYDVIVRALKGMAIGQVIDESNIIKKELLSELAVVLGILTKTTTETDLYSAIKQTKGNINSLFKYHIIKNSDLGKLAVQVTLDSDIIDVEGFPLTAYVEDNVNQVVEKHIKMKNRVY